MDKIQRATEIHRSMTPHQMALRIVELEDIAEIVGQSASERGKRITELQDALELAEEAVRAKHSPDAAKMVPDGWQLVPVEPTIIMVSNGASAQEEKLRDYALGGSLPPIGHGVDAAYRAMLSAAPKLGGE